MILDLVADRSEEKRQPHGSFQLAGDEFLMAGADCGQCELWFSYVPHQTGYGRRIWNAEIAKQTGANRIYGVALPAFGFFCGANYIDLSEI